MALCRRGDILNAVLSQPADFHHFDPCTDHVSQYPYLKFFGELDSYCLGPFT
ncbi:hypothetical protein TDMWS_07930 [Thermodesulfomicrobium sp. WS]|nr:hypothetical protein TDMWS_07930 [Thermodesulfomicrobium sp. WS]